MSWYDTTAEKLENNKVYSHAELVDKLSDTKPGLSGSGYHWAINSMVHDGLLVRDGRGEYKIPDVKGLKEYSPIYSDTAKKLTGLISETYPYVAFTVFETVLMNDFLNHLIAQNTIFIQAEKESSVYVFRLLQEKGYKNLMYKPGKKDFGLYWSRDCVIVTDLISEAPIRTDQPHSIMLEKVLVDMCADKLISTTFSKAELPDVFANAKNQYLIDKSRMMRYARRRNKEGEIKEYFGSE